ncbi:dephospho-CoA kinase [Sphingobacterium sp. LRF_L2]|uniref:dephospho-CoA kinase n=1 Tax=Sphingobacterium sp. LRF_L2 TaxID=3369421 RepID=UPI003F5F25DC
MGLKIGITGGIGSGKSYIGRIFKALGVPFYDADAEAKKLMNDSPMIREALIEAFGQEVYEEDNNLNRSYLSALVFKDKEKLALLNSIVHPAVIQHAVDWADQQHYPYSLKEAALLFESGSFRNLDFTILVTAPESLRIQRVMQRDGVGAEEVQARISKQMSEDEKVKLADFVIINDDYTALLPQVLDLHHQFLKEDQCQ